MSNSNTVRNEVSKLAQQIEALARQVQDKISQGSDPLGVANELARSSSVFVFALGEMYALEEMSKTTGKTVKVTTVSNPNNTARSKSNYHNVRDSLGRFTRV
jgi:hypothetical protein